MAIRKPFGASAAPHSLSGCSYKAPKSPMQAMMILDAMATAGKVETSLVRELGRIMLPKPA